MRETVQIFIKYLLHWAIWENQFSILTEKEGSSVYEIDLNVRDTKIYLTSDNM